MTAAETIIHIVRDERGVACIKGKNVKVIEVVLDHVAYGWSADAIHEQHPHLSLAEIHSALAYYYDHPAEFEAETARQAQELKALRNATGESSLQKRLTHQTQTNSEIGTNLIERLLASPVPVKDFTPPIHAEF